MDPAVIIAKSPIKYVYASKDDIQIPVNAKNIITARDDIWEICIGDKYKQEYPINKVFKENSTILIIENIIEITFKDGSKQCNVTWQNASDKCFFNTVKSAELALACTKNECCLINKTILWNRGNNPICKLISQDAIQYFQYIITLDKLLKELQISNLHFTTEEVFEASKDLRMLKRMLVDKEPIPYSYLSLPNDVGLYNQRIGNKKILLEYHKTSENTLIMQDYLRESNDIAIFDCSIEPYKKLKKWFVILPEDLSSTLFDRELMLKELSDCNEEIEIDRIILYVLQLLKEYDTNKNESLFEFLKRLHQIVENKRTDSATVVINKAQIHMREQGLTKVDKNNLLKIKVNGNLLEKCCSCILLKQHDEFKLVYDQLDHEEKEELQSWPIYNLL